MDAAFTLLRRRSAVQRAEVAGGVANAKASFRHSGTVRTRSKGVDAAFMQFQRHGWDIHALCVKPDGAAG
jgi:hypothetical protein